MHAKCPNPKCTSDKLEVNSTYAYPAGVTCLLVYCRQCGHTIGVVNVPK